MRSAWRYLKLNCDHAAASALGAKLSAIFMESFPSTDWHVTGIISAFAGPRDQTQSWSSPKRP